MKRIIFILAVGALVGCHRQGSVDTTVSMPAPPAPATATFAPPDATTAPPLPPMVSADGSDTSGRPVRTDAAPLPPVNPDSASRVSIEDLKGRMQQGNVVVLDVRNRVAFEMEHAKGAVNIPLEEIATRLGELPRDKYIAAYCT